MEFETILLYSWLPILAWSFVFGCIELGRNRGDKYLIKYIVGFFYPIFVIFLPALILMWVGNKIQKQNEHKRTI